MMTKWCEKQCFTLQYMPLILAKGKTAHTFQEQSAGPGHPIEAIIVQLGNKSLNQTAQASSMFCCLEHPCLEQTHIIQIQHLLCNT